MTSRIACLLIVAMTLPAYAPGQPAINQGDRVRIHRVSGTVVTGVVQSASPEAIRLLGVAGAPQLIIPQGEVGQVERSLGRRRNFGKNFAITVVSSAIVIGGVSAITWSPCADTVFLGCLFHPESRSEAFAWGLAGGAIIGTPIGIIVGLAVKHERWERVLLAGPGEATLSIQPILARDFGFSASLAFGGR